MNRHEHLSFPRHSHLVSRSSLAHSSLSSSSFLAYNSDCSDFVAQNLHVLQFLRYVIAFRVTKQQKSSALFGDLKDQKERKNQKES